MPIAGDEKVMGVLCGECKTASYRGIGAGPVRPCESRCVRARPSPSLSPRLTASGFENSPFRNWGIRARYIPRAGVWLPTPLPPP